MREGKVKMSPSLDQLTQAVVERLMAQVQRRTYPQHRRSPRAYIKSLKDTRRTVPQVVMPNGPMPDEPWYDPHEDEDEVVRITASGRQHLEEQFYLRGDA
jgi:hypothetical protein